MRLDKILIMQIEIMLVESFANFGMNEAHMPYILCLAIEAGKATLDMASHWQVRSYDPTMDGVRMSQQAIRLGKFKPDMTDEQYAELCHSYLVSGFFSATGKAREER